MHKQGQIYQILAGYYDIKTDNEMIRLRAAGKLRFNEITPLVGDFVVFDNFVEKIEKRKSSLIRPKVANVDQVLIVVSLKEPELNSFLLDKYLALVYESQLKPIIIFTKADLDYSANLEFYLANHECYLVRKDDESSYQQLIPLFKNHLSALMGQSGVGKTTIFNYLTGEDNQTQAISKALNRGKHTTRVVRMIDFLGGQLIDAPGFGTVEIDSQKLHIANTFIFFKDYQFKCVFRSCLHHNEPVAKCYVKQALEQGLFPNWRYENYLKIIGELKK